MSTKSSKAAEWWSALEPAPAAFFHGPGDPEDPRLGEVAIRFDGTPCEFHAGQPVLIGFPCDEGVRRNGGRPGAAAAPQVIREQLYRFTTWDPLAKVNLAKLDLLDLGNVRIDADLERAQDQLGNVVAGVLEAGAIPVLMGGGHETAFGHYLGYVKAGLKCAILNVDAHLDVRPYPQGGHSGSPFRQAFEHPTHPLKPGRYMVLGAQRQSVARAHWKYVKQYGGRVRWFEPHNSTYLNLPVLMDLLDRLHRKSRCILMTVDADAFRQADVPGCSAPSPVGLDGSAWPEFALVAGSDTWVRSIDLVEVNPQFDRDGQTARWAALGLRQFLVGLAARGKKKRKRKGDLELPDVG